MDVKVVTPNVAHRPIDKIPNQVPYRIIDELQKKDSSPKKEVIENHINTLNNYLEPTKTSLKFQLHDKLNEYYVQIIDTNTDEVIKEIPSKKFLDRYAATAELLGFMVDQKI